MRCPVCSEITALFGSAQILGRYTGRFRRCPRCDFLFAEEPIWLQQAYAEAITPSDIGLVDRNLWFSRVTRTLVTLFCNANGRFLDYGGGTGLFTRLMRDAGYDWHCIDQGCPNIFAREFSISGIDAEQYELITAAELFEHLPDPLTVARQLRTCSANLLCTTQLLPDPPPALGSWWYYGLEHGQHISFYSQRTLAAIGDATAWKLSSNGTNLHLFSRRQIPTTLFRLITSPYFTRLVSMVRQRSSLLQADFARLGNRSDHAHRP